MKNTVKKILALVFVVAMVCSLAVPAFADFSAFNVSVIVVGPNGEILSEQADDTTTADVNEYSKAVSVNVAKAEKANVLDALKAADVAEDNFKLTVKNNVLAAVATPDAKGEDKVIDIDDKFDTETWVVTVNGKTVNGDLGAASIAKDDVIVVYWTDTAIDAKLVMFDDSAIAQGIVSFYYYDAEGTKQPLVGAAVELSGLKNEMADSTVTATGANADDKGYLLVEDYDTFVTDEKGQIWIAPEYLEGKVDGEYGKELVYTITSVSVKAPAALRESDGYTLEEVAYFNTLRAKTLVKTLVVNESVVVDANLYDVAGATGDMTVVYALVAFAAVATLAAVVVMKKKSVKAN